MGDCLIRSATASAGACHQTRPLKTSAPTWARVSTEGDFAAAITNLEPDSLYYVRAYATNSAGTAYGTEVTFSTFSTLDTDADGFLDYVDEDDDGDGISDAEEGLVDTDGDGAPR